MTSLKQGTLAALVLAAAFAAPASANVATGNLPLDVQSAVSGEGIVNVRVKDGVATLTGHANPASRVAAERTALEHDGVTDVINLIQEGQ